jgi:hypothetical protein
MLDYLYSYVLYSLHQSLAREDLSVGYMTKVQVIERAKGQRQFYLICPAPLAQALEIEKGETIEWVVEDKWTLRVRRLEAMSAQAPRRFHAKR